MKIKDKAKPKEPPVPPGAYIGICIGVIDLGEQYSEQYKKYSPKVQIVFELVGQTVEVDGEQKPRQLSKTFTFSTGKKAALRTFLSQWLGTELSDEQAANFELFDLINRPAYLNVLLNETGEYANIAGVMQLPSGYPTPQMTTPPIRWDMDQWDDAVFETLPEWVKDKIKSSTQYQKSHPPTGTIDFAAAPQFPPNPAPVAAPVAAPAPGGTVTPAASQSATAANSAPNSAPAATGVAAASPINFAAYAQPGAAVPAAQPQIINQGGSAPF